MAMLVAHVNGPRQVFAARHAFTSTKPVAARVHPQPHPISKRSVKCNGKFGDELLDFVTAGPKLRKWYGQGQLPTDGGGFDDLEPPPEEDDAEDESAKDAVLVTDADSPTGEQVLLQLILSRANIKAVFSDVAAAKVSYGPYVTPLSVDLRDGRAVRGALRGVRAAVVVGQLGCLPQVAQQAGLEHLVLLSAAGLQAQGGLSLGSLFGSRDGIPADPAREAAVFDSGVPCTIVRASQIRDTPGGSSRLKLLRAEQDAAKLQPAGPIPISRQDVALAAARALESVPQSGALVCQVVAEGPGSPPTDWAALFAALSPTEAPAQSVQS